MNVFDMDFEDDVASDVLKAHSEVLYKADDEMLEGDNRNLNRLVNIQNTLVGCMDNAKRSNVFFEFYIPRPDKWRRWR